METHSMPLVMKSCSSSTQKCQHVCVCVSWRECILSWQEAQTMIRDRTRLPSLASGTVQCRQQKIDIFGESNHLRGYDQDSHFHLAST